MSICKNCKKSAGLFALAAPTRMDRAQLLASVIAMRNVILASDRPGASEDKAVNASLIARLVMSFPEPQRSSIMAGFQTDLQVLINVDSCPHSKLEVVS